MGLTRLRADSRGTPTARGRQCRMSKKDKRRVRRGSRKQKHTEHTNQFEQMKARWTLSLPQTSRANPVQCCSTHQKKLRAHHPISTVIVGLSPPRKKGGKKRVQKAESLLCHKDGFAEQQKEKRKESWCPSWLFLGKRRAETVSLNVVQWLLGSYHRDQEKKEVWGRKNESERQKVFWVTKTESLLGYKVGFSKFRSKESLPVRKKDRKLVSFMTVSR